MLAIRLQRTGRTKQPFYRLVVSEKAKDTYGDHLEILGSYNPRSKEAQLKTERIKYWLEKGAQASASAYNLLIKQEVVSGDKKKAVRISKKRAAKKQAKEKPAREAKPETESKEEPAEEKPAEEKPAAENENKEAESATSQTDKK